MGLIWWVLPSIAGVIALLLLFAGFAKMANLKPFAGVTRLLFGTAFAAIAGVIVFAGLNIQTYKRLTYERPVATIRFAALPEQTGVYRADVTFSDGRAFLQADGTAPVFRGNEWQIGARVIKFKPMANVLGYDSIYRLDHMSSIDTGQFMADRVREGTIDRIQIVPEEPGIDIGNLARTYGSRFGIDAEYGSATYQPMGDGFEFEVSITQDALIARPTEATRVRIQQQSYPGFQPTRNR
jgi:hypothetical protein